MVQMVMLEADEQGWFFSLA